MDRGPSYRKIPPDPVLARRARLLALAGDETRIRIFCFMFEYGEACVSDIAESLGANINTISHHLRLMKDNGLLASERSGANVCYTLVVSDFTENLKRAVCE